jgi:hypothetical protein
MLSHDTTSPESKPPQAPPRMSPSLYTLDKLNALKKIYKSYDIPCTIKDIHAYEEWCTTNKTTLPWSDRWHNMMLYTRSILNPSYSWKDISDHEYNTLIKTWDRATRCTCKMCTDHYNPRGFTEIINLNYKAYLAIHGLFPTSDKNLSVSESATLESTSQRINLKEIKEVLKKNNDELHDMINIIRLDLEQKEVQTSKKPSFFKKLFTRCK